jgi:sporulation protein YlmC with PRC-barrel domain
MKKLLMTLIAISASLLLITGVAFSAERYGERTIFQTPQHLNEVIGSNVVNHQNQQLGTVYDLVADEQGKLEYLILSKGERVGIRQELVAIPIDVVSPRMTAENELRIDMTQATLDQAQTFTAGDYPDYGDSRWQQEVRGYFGAEPHVRPGPPEYDMLPHNGKTPR